MLSQENVNTRLNRLERQTTQLKICVFLLLGYVLFSSGVNDTIAELMSAEPPSSLTAPRESKEPREQAKPAVPSSSISKPALTKQANVSNLVQTRRLQLIDNNGTTVLDFYASSDGGGVMNVHNGSGERTIQLYGSPQGGGVISLYNGSGNRTVTLSGGEDAGGQLFINQPDGNSLMYFGASLRGHALVALGGNGKNGIFRIENDTDQTVVTLAASSESKHGRLWLNAANGNTLVEAGQNTGGHGGIWIANAEEENHVTLGATDKSGSISLYHSNGSMVFYAGGDSDDDGLIRIRKSSGEKMFSAGISRGLEPLAVIELHSLSTGERLVYLGESTENTGILALSDSDGREMLRAVAMGNQGIINSYNSDNNVIFRLDGPNGNGRVRTFTSSGQTAFSSDNVTASGSSTSGLTGDIDGDGDVDGDDFLLLSHHFGRSSTKKTSKTEVDGQ